VHYLLVLLLIKIFFCITEQLSDAASTHSGSKPVNDAPVVDATEGQPPRSLPPLARVSEVRDHETVIVAADVHVPVGGGNDSGWILLNSLTGMKSR